MWIIDTNVEDPITAQGALDELQHHQTKRGKPKVDIIPCMRKSFQIIVLEEIRFIFDQVNTMVSQIEVCLP